MWYIVRHLLKIKLNKYQKMEVVVKQVQKSGGLEVVKGQDQLIQVNYNAEETFGALV